MSQSVTWPRCRFLVTYHDDTPEHPCGADVGMDGLCGSHAGLLLDRLKKAVRVFEPVAKELGRLGLNAGGKVPDEHVTLWHTSSNIPDRPSVRITKADVMRLVEALAAFDEADLR